MKNGRSVLVAGSMAVGVLAEKDAAVIMLVRNM